MASLTSRVVALTGAASGIGLACAKLLAARGATLSIGDINASALDAAVKIIDPKGIGKIRTQTVDVRDRLSVRAFITDTKIAFGPLDGCANIAGVIGKSSNVSPIWEVDSKEYKFIMEVNTEGVFNCIAEQLRPGVINEGGSIVNMASIAGLMGLEKNAPYCASKFAVVGLTKASAKEAGPRKIRVNCVCPGGIDTPMIRADAAMGEVQAIPGVPIQRIGEPNEVASLVSFLLGNESRYISGSAYTIDGGWQS